MQKFVDSFVGAPDVVITSINTDFQTDTLIGSRRARGRRAGDTLTRRSLGGELADTRLP